ncbi:MAG: efflux RND transporter periplasmic adaptor subunit [Burkholderiaceae bacterium]|nr:efflux RND transporter periplasmic adaptor subunit [Burkholderiaceae bacterium]
MKSDLYRPLTLALLLGSSLLVLGCSKPMAQNTPQAAPEVTVATVLAQSIALTTELAGRTSAYLISEVRPQVGGIVKARQFKEGSDVQAGDILYTIDAATYQATYNSAKAAVDKAQANLKVVSLAAQRYQELVKIDAVSRQANDQAVAELSQAKADVAAARAALDMAGINLGYTKIAAPISGRIGQSSITPGALLSANQLEPLARIQQLDPMYVDVSQSSVELLRLRKALESGALTSSETAKVQLTLEDGSSYAHAGELQFSDVSVDPNTGMVTLRAVFPNPDQQLLPGMYVRAVLEEGVREQAILVPQQGVTRDSTGNATALLVNAEGKVEARVLKATRTIGDQWLVEAGIASGERVIVEGVQKVRPGAAVTAVEKNTSVDSAAVASAG